MLNCSYCGKAVPEHARFCGNCGSLVEQASMISAAGEQQSFRPQVLSQDYPTLLSNPEQDELEDEVATFQSDILAPQQVQERHTPAPPSFYEDAPAMQRGWGGSGAGYPSGSADDLFEEDEYERRRRAMLFGGIVLGADGAQAAPSQAGNAPMFQGTPQAGNAPILQGTPQVAGRVQNFNNFSNDLPTRAAGNAQPAGYGVVGQRVQPQQGAYPVRPVRTQAPRVPKQAGSSRLFASTVSRWIVLVSVAVVVIITAGIGVAVFASSPTLTVQNIGSSKTVKVGGSLHLYGKGFFPGGKVIFKRNDGQRVYQSPQQLSSTAHSNSLSMSLLRVAQSQQAQSQTAAVIVNGSGEFQANIAIDTGWSAGQHTIFASEDGSVSRSASVTFTVDTAPAALSFSPETLQCGDLTKGVKAALSLTLSNTGGETLDWSLNAGGTSWIIVQRQSGTIQAHAAPQAVILTCDTSTLKPGNYSTTLQIHAVAGDKTLADKTVKVGVHVLGSAAKQEAKLSVHPATLDFGTVVLGSQAAQTLTLSNIGTADLDWKATVPNDASWVSVDKTSGKIKANGDPQQFTVSIDTTNLAEGDYSPTLLISSNGGVVRVTLNVHVSATVIPTPTSEPPTTLPPTSEPPTTVPPTSGAPTATPTSTPTPTPTSVPTPTPTPTPVPTPTPTPTPVPIPTPTPTPVSPTPTPVPPTPTPVPPTPTPQVVPTPTSEPPTPTAQVVPTPTTQEMTPTPVQSGTR